MADLFTAKPRAPLAELLRPKSLDEFVGQQHLLGPGKPLRLAFEARSLHSFIMWGPPGVGKTTLGRLAAMVTDSHFIAISAVLAGVKDIRQAIDDARAELDVRGRSTVLFVDEIHRFNKAQQDALLPHVESGLLTLVGGTTEHPGLAVNSALLSRAQVYTLEPLSDADLEKLYERARPHLRGVDLSDPALQLLKGFADGDGRRFLNLLEQVSTAASEKRVEEVDLEFAKRSTSPSLRRFDKGGDEFYWQLSAFHKSLRGSDPDASLYWLARILDGGGDVSQVTRRMIVMASEDIGNADPGALHLAIHAAQAYERLGSPEGEIVLAQAATYLALSPKSNASYAAWDLARAFVKEHGSLPVPMHLRNAPAKLMRQMGYRQAYRYAHHEPDGYAAGQTYLPEGVERPNWYRPTDRGAERALAERQAWQRALDEEASQTEADPSSGQ
ncbi:replication-associated recombination protein A [Stenotrophomonas maltophilia]|uniref:Replication-associated recombination protein A n=4 Tax=Gammaproteobacteria TaxID=1236 RepID=A0A7W3FK86_9GAMM|nr:MULTISPECIES: replication-associated recombination protein A [Stenotrophomonas]AVO30401.1 replication-associated recombination protein A [Stenotrophomonas maltophilia]EKT2104013.1 replication-associated recombination protein A [Stenotrophomonas maltophilia]EKU9957730.1 replication-associated recombination protein A [Stenotrophomonas maltophilia]EKU9974407.1 replication-associated recombination protein A [Stenotrophomonas maltophilia]EKU9983880.1 replication-associated recombination protein 